MTGAFPLVGATANADAFLHAAQQKPGSIDLGGIPIVGPAIAAVKAGTGQNLFGASGWFGVRGLTLILGLLLIAGAIFSHPTVISVAKKAGEAAAVAA